MSEIYFKQKIYESYDVNNITKEVIKICHIYHHNKKLALLNKIIALDLKEIYGIYIFGYFFLKKDLYFGWFCKCGCPSQGVSGKDTVNTSQLYYNKGQSII